MLCNSVQSSGEIESYYEDYEANFYIENQKICNFQCWASKLVAAYLVGSEFHGNGQNILRFKFVKKRLTLDFWQTKWKNVHFRLL